MPTILLPSDATIWYQRSGHARAGRPPLLHIHGSAFGHRNFEKLTPPMAEHVEVIDFDLPGYGESHGGPSFTTMDGIAELVGELITALGHERVDLHGTSFGALVGLSLAARQPERIDRLVLSCFLARYDQAARMMRATWKRAALEIGMEAVADLTSVAGFARSFYDRPEAQAQLAAMRAAFAKNTPQAFVAGTETIERTDLGELVAQVRAPTLLLAGAEDQMTPFKPAASGLGFAQIEPRFADARMVVLPECGHYLVIEQAEEAARHIAGFLRR